MTSVNDLISAAISSVFVGNTPNLRTSYDRWEHDGNAAGGINASRRPTVSIMNDASTKLGANAEQRYVAIIESPPLYVGMAGNDDTFEILKQQFKPRLTDIIFEARYGVDREMSVATPFMAAYEGNQTDLFTLDSFPIAGVPKNWQSTAPSSIKLSTSANDAMEARRTPASNNATRIHEQREMATAIGKYKSHPQESRLREIRYIAINGVTNLIWGTGTTTEQRRRLPSVRYQGSNYTAANTEVAALFTISHTTGLSTLVAEYNGVDWDSALLKQIHLISHDEGLGILYGIMPPGSHQEYIDSIGQHLGTLVEINKTTAEVTNKKPILWTPMPGGPVNLEIKSFHYDQSSGGNLILVRYTDGNDPAE